MADIPHRTRPLCMETLAADSSLDPVACAHVESRTICAKDLRFAGGAGRQRAIA